MDDLDILVHPMMHPPMGLPLVPRGPMDPSYRFPPQGPVILRGGPAGMARPPMQIALGPRGPVPGGPMVLGRMPGPPSQQHVLVMQQQQQRPGLPPNVNGPPLVRQPVRPGAPVPSSSMTIMPGQHPPGYYPGQPAPGQGAPPHPDPYYRGGGPDAAAPIAPISEVEFQGIMEQNKNVSSSAIARAVQDASAGE